MQIEAEARGLEARSAALAARIRRAQAAPPAAGAASTNPATSIAPPAPPPPASGPSQGSSLAWPVNGTLTSSFGARWGRMHEGLDIAGPSGTPIGAAAPGTVIVAAFSGGYGNLVVVDHGGGLSTAYAHMSSIAVGVGQSVGQGATVGGMGTTGNSTGVHLHFEVRVNGAAQDPFRYL